MIRFEVARAGRGWHFCRGSHVTEAVLIAQGDFQREKQDLT